VQPVGQIREVGAIDLVAHGQDQGRRDDEGFAPIQVPGSHQLEAPSHHQAAGEFQSAPNTAGGKAKNTAASLGKQARARNQAPMPRAI